MSNSIRTQLNHPIVDIDGHLLELMPVYVEYLRDEVGASCFEQFVSTSMWSTRRSIGPPNLNDAILSRTPNSGWWQYPAENTLDRATVMLPSLLEERLGELGIDYAVLYPTNCLGVAGLDQTELRVGACRAYNNYIAEHLAPHVRHMTGAGVIPMDTPHEALEALEHCHNLGLKVVTIPHAVLRPIERPRSNQSPYRTATGTWWLDTYGLDSAYDYDPVWEAFQMFGYVVNLHYGVSFPGSEIDRSVTNFSFNHVGMHSRALSTTAKSLFMGGVPFRFPGLRFSFLEAGVMWALDLVGSVLEHMSKRSVFEMASRDPQRLDRRALVELLDHHLADGERERICRRFGSLAEVVDDLATYTDTAPDNKDDFVHMGDGDPAHAADRFADAFYFGCEADDGNVALALARNSAAARSLRCCFSSDIGHWDVADMSGVLNEAWELVDESRLTSEEFRDFACDNAVRMFTDLDPEFFVDTAVGSHAEAFAQLREAAG